MVHKHCEKSQHLHKPAFTRQYFLPLQNSDITFLHATRHLRQSTSESSELPIVSPGFKRHNVTYKSKAHQLLTFPTRFIPPTTLILSTYFHRYFTCWKIFVHSFLLFCYHKIKSRQAVCKQLCELPYHTCVLIDHGFLNKPKHVVTILTNKINFSVYWRRFILTSYILHKRGWLQ